MAMPRDRLAELHVKMGKDPTVVFSKCDSVSKQKRFMDNFFLEVEEIQCLLESVRVNTQETKKLQNAALSSPRLEDNTKMELDARRECATKSLGLIRNRLQGMEAAIKKDDKSSTKGLDLRIRKTQYGTLCQRLMDVFDEFTAAEVDYKNRCTERIRKQLSIVKNNYIEDSELDTLLEKENFAIFTHDLISETQDVRLAVANIEERHKEILKVENSIREIRDLFVNISVYVATQGESINRIERHILDGAEYATKGKKQLLSAEKKRTVRRKRMIKLSICIVVIIGILIFILWYFS